MRASDYRLEARTALTGKWLSAALVTLVAALLGGIATGSSTSYEFNSDSSTLYLTDEMRMYAIVIILSVLAVAILYSVLVGPVIGMGYNRYILNLVDGNNPGLSDLFHEFRKGNYRRAVILSLLSGALILAGMLLFIIPGIIAAYAYSMASYIRLEYPELTARECLTASRKLMNGHKWRFYCLNLSFIGWAILSAFTFGIGGLFLTPYQNTACAAFYRDLTNGIQIEDYL